MGSVRLCWGYIMVSLDVSSFENRESHLPPFNGILERKLANERLNFHTRGLLLIGFFFKTVASGHVI